MSAAARRTALITGASAGIGLAFAELYAAKGHDLVVTARREDRLRALAERLGRAHGIRVHVVAADLERRDAPRELCETLAARGITVDVLVNNAGYGVPGAFLKHDWARHQAFLDIMVGAVCELTHRLLPGMIERGYGRVINVASLAGLVPSSAGHTLYGASKAFLIKFSEALAQEVARHGVHVCALCPGFTYSEFHDVTGTRAKVSTMPGWLWMHAPEVVRDGYDAVEAGLPIVVPGRVNRTIALLVRLLPGAIVQAVNRRASRSFREH